MSLSGRLDDVAIGAPGHHAILHLAGGGEIAGEPDADREQDNGDEEPGDGPKAAIAGILFRIGHRTVVQRASKADRCL